MAPSRRRRRQAVFWERGEEHETTSASGLTALILEGDGLQPYAAARSYSVSNPSCASSSVSITTSLPSASRKP